MVIENAADTLDTSRMATNHNLSDQQPRNIRARILSDARGALNHLENSEDRFPRRLDAIPWPRVCGNRRETRDGRRGANNGDDFLEAA
jgi:hypothetical protein